MVNFPGTTNNDDTTTFYLQSELIGDDILMGDLGQDLLKGFEGNDIIKGGSGEDTLDGGEGNDSLNGDDNDDTLLGDNGDDTIDGGLGNDRIFGGLGNDRIFGRNGDDFVKSGAGNDYIEGGLGNDTLDGENDHDHLQGGLGNDQLQGGNGDDTLDGEDGDDRIFGGQGDDRIFGGNGDDFVKSGAGNDYVEGGSGNDLLDGEVGNDLLKAGEGDDRIFGGKGDDTIDGGQGSDEIFGGQGNDSIFGGLDDDRIFGEGDHDFVKSGAGNDYVEGGLGNDTLAGENGDDQIFGGRGNDQLQGGNGDDTLDGEHGDDRIFGGQGDDRIFGGNGDDFVKSGAGNDYVEGGSGNDTLDGETSHDHLKGGDGDDYLYGGLANDTLDGGQGNDNIFGGRGQDTFVLAPDAGVDTINDFQVGDDKIQLNGGLTFDNLKISSLANNQTLIQNLVTGEDLAILKGVQSTDINHANNFVVQDNSPLRTVRSLDGSGNNLLNDSLGQSGNIYLRVGKDTTYAPGEQIDVNLPNARFVSNRIFNDLHVNLFSENNASHLTFVWGQFLDHTFGLAAGGGEEANIAFDQNDPLEDFQNDFGSIGFNRSQGVQVDQQREQINTVSSFIDAWAIYGGEEARLDWLREGSKDGDSTNNSAYLELDQGYLPTRDFLAQKYQTSLDNIPDMDFMSRLRNDQGAAILAGDVRANENTGLTATHTLFAREHNRIVDLLPDNLDEESKFQIARKVITAEQQYITYNEFLPSVGIELNQYQGYNSQVDPSITNEFATVGYRAHSMVHGDFDFDTRQLTDADLATLESQGGLEDGGVIEIPVNTQSGNPSVVSKVGLGPVFEGLFETNYNNDVQIDNQLRSILFQIPVEGGFSDGPQIENLFNGVVDIGAIDIQRGRDHGILSYNDLRSAFGLERVDSFYDITGEDPEAIKEFVDSQNLIDVDGTQITSAELIFDAGDLNLNDPSIIDFIAVLDEQGEVVADPQEIAKLLADNQEVEGISAIQRSTVAARLEAVYTQEGDTSSLDALDRLDAFTGMIAEEHLPGTEFGELQLAIWKDQFENLRDGDRLFYLNDPDLSDIKATFGIDYQHSFADIIANNTDLNRGDIFDNVFFSEPHLAADAGAEIV